MKVRNSNIELLRILMMLLIMAHHLVVNSDLYTTVGNDSFSGHSLAVYLFGFGGKIGLNVFLLITGYFMCTSQVTVKRWLKLFIECVFYGLVINLVFIIINYHPKGFSDIIGGMLPPFLRLGSTTDYYPALFLILLLLIPFLNKLVSVCSKRELQILLIILFTFFTIISSFSFKYDSRLSMWLPSDDWEGVGWYCAVYLAGAFIRKHCGNKVDNLKIGLISSVIFIVLSFASIAFLSYGDFIVTQYHLLAGSNKIFAIGTAVSLFILFKNLKVPQSRIINLVASATFGVLLIHTNNGTMRQLIWDKIFKVTSYYSDSIPIMLLKMAGTVVLLFIICTIISLLVKYFILKPLFKLLDKTRFANKVLYTFK